MYMIFRVFGVFIFVLFVFFFFSSRRRHTRCALVTGVQTCALPISWRMHPFSIAWQAAYAHRVAAAVRRMSHLSCLWSWGFDQHHLRRCRPAVVWRHDRLACPAERSEEHTSELQSLMRISYAVFCLKKKQTQHTSHPYDIDYK